MLIIDKYTLFHLAKAIKARQDVLNDSGSEEEANSAFEAEMFMAYSPEVTIEALEQFPNLLDLLIELLTEDFRLKNNPGEVSTKRDEIWRMYEFLRRMACYDEIGLKLLE